MFIHRSLTQLLPFQRSPSVDLVTVGTAVHKLWVEVTPLYTSLVAHISAIILEILQ